jgi:hypothetical protein
MLYWSYFNWISDGWDTIGSNHHRWPKRPTPSLGELAALALAASFRGAHNHFCPKVCIRSRQFVPNESGPGSCFWEEGGIHTYIQLIHSLHDIQSCIYELERLAQDVFFEVLNQLGG